MFVIISCRHSPEDLSELLAAGTKEVHEKAENTQFVKDFLRGRIRKELFKVGLCSILAGTCCIRIDRVT